MTRVLARALILLVLTTALVVDPSFSWLPTRPMTTDVTSVALAFAATESDDDVADDGTALWTTQAVANGATVTGVTWDDPDAAPSLVEFRAQVDGVWSDWQEAHVDDDHLPDPGTSEAEVGRGGTPPIVVAGSDAFQFRVAADEQPTGLTAMVVDVDDPDADRRELHPLEAQADLPRPPIQSRASWNGDSCVRRDPSDISYVRDVEILFVHHTTGHTSYGRDDVAGIVNGICSYHVRGRGWSDIGYNALIDRFGRVWEGRAGGIHRGVQGAHTGGFNSYSTGVAFIGDHENAGAPTSAAQDALATYAAWKLSVHDVEPLSRTTVVSQGSSKWRSGTRVTFDAISGHRDASSTSCPGSYCYRLLPDFRTAVQAQAYLVIAGGDPSQPRYQPREGAWPDVTAASRFSAPARWTVTITDRLTGDVMHRTSGTSESSWIRWKPVVDGRPAPKGSYRITVRANRVSDDQYASRATSFMLHAPVGVFDDVPPAHTFRSVVRRLAEGGVTRGCTPPFNLRFCPEKRVTRGEMAAFLVRALDLPVGTTRFADTRGHTFESDIAALADAGITQGCGHGRFCPDGVVTRSQMAVFLTRALDLPSGSAQFVDTRQHRYRNQIAAVARAGITRGCNPPANDRFCPQRSVTRSQMAAFLVRAGLVD